MTLRSGVLVDVAASSGGVALYRVLRSGLLPSRFHNGTERWALMRRYDPRTRRFLKPSPVQVDRVLRVYNNTNNPLVTPLRPRTMMGRKS